MGMAGKKPFTDEDKELVFKMATASLPKYYASEITTGMTDEQLESALQSVLGIFGGSCGPDKPSVTFSGSGLRIWGGWHIVNHVTEKPIFKGKVTLTMARRVYNIADPNNKQLDLF